MEYVFLVIRLIIIFTAIMLIIRVLGKREVGELSIFDLVVLLMIADLGSMGIDDEKMFWTSICCLVVLLVLQKILSKLAVKFNTLRNLFEGNPRVLIENGKINIEAMRKENYTIDDLITQIRERKIMDVSEVNLAVLETNGTLSVFRKQKYENIRLPIVLSGKVTKESLDTLMICENEVQNFFIKSKLNMSDIIYASFDGKTVYYYSKNNKKLLELKKLNWQIKD